MVHLLHVAGEKPVEVPVERWKWEAHYVDGTIIKQFGDDDHFHRIAEVVPAGLKELWMVADGKKPLKVTIPKGAEPIHFYRNTRLFIGTIREQSSRLYCFGYKLGDNQVLQAIFPDDHVETIT